MENKDVATSWDYNSAEIGEFVPNSCTGTHFPNGIACAPWFQQQVTSQPHLCSSEFASSVESVGGPACRVGSEGSDYCFVNKSVCRNEEEGAEEVEGNEEESSLRWGMHIHPAALRAVQASSREVVQGLIRDKELLCSQFGTMQQNIPLAITWHDTTAPSPNPTLASTFTPLPHKKRSRDLVTLLSGISPDWEAAEEVGGASAAAHVGGLEIQRKRFRVDNPTIGSAAYEVSKAATAESPKPWIKARQKRAREEGDEDVNVNVEWGRGRDGNENSGR
ncbi:hypothetical protein DPX39_100029100 [Trypanosoma brucei equiperdum]|uniref:Uncharacterized protein n=1 Tax=Trypanosoma brucei equiperdum TaxID=630700 RepID=A0A3L6L0C1_9TRYP|nr:hypothetical protein DPX39_100029100 [Trypanosoma brucei equiperdum]